MFNPRPVIQALPIHAGHKCLVIDDALIEPERWVDFAAGHLAHFQPAAHNAFPGPELALPADAAAALDDFFRQHIRARLGGRRTLAMNARLSMVALPPAALQPRQWFCHRDHQQLQPGECIAASVLYLFNDESLGGTSFYVPRRPMPEIDLLIHHASTLDSAAFSARYGDITPGYLLESNAWFERVLVVPPKWNRLIFYDGSLFHSSHVSAPHKLNTDPRNGRLTMNGFFTCRRSAG